MQYNSEPFFWKSRGAWFVKATSDAGKRTNVWVGKTKKEGKLALEKLAAESAEVVAIADQVLVETLVDQWAGVQMIRVERGEVTIGWLKRNLSMLNQFLVAHPELTCDDFKPFTLLDWIATKKWKPNTERMLLTVTKQVFRWGVRTKRIKENPIDGIDMPLATRADGCVTDEQHRLMFDRCGLDRRTRPLRPLIVLLRHSGCRPGELATMTASDLSDDCSTITLTKHKSSKKRGAKSVYLSPCGQTIAKILRSVRTDTMLLNGRGQPWTRNAIRIRFRRLRESLGLPPSIVAYSYRHAFATQALVSGVDIATVAELLGHASTEMISRHYGHLANEKQHLKDAAARVIRPRADG
jgi:site-specific recombinase XerD